MVECGLLNLGACLPQKFFEFLIDILNAPVTPLLNLTLNLLSEPINLSIFFSLWAIIVYMLSMFYSLLLLGSGFSFMISGYDSSKREQAKSWLRNIVIMIILVQASFFMYSLLNDLSSTMTSAVLSLIDPNFFLINVDGIADLGLAVVFVFLYLATLIITALILIIRYAFVCIGVVFLPIGIFFYFFAPLKHYGSLILNSLGFALFVSFFAGILLTGFSRLATVGIFANMQILVLIAAFLVVDIIMVFMMFFNVVRAAVSIYSDVKGFGGKS